MLVVHPHLHRRRTGVTSHTEAVVRQLRAEGVDARVYGGQVDEALPRVTLGEVRRRARAEAVVWHAHRNNELLLALLLRLVGVRLRVVMTRHSSTRPSWWSRFLLRRADVVIALSEEATRVLPVKATVVSHGVDLARFSPPASRAEAFAALRLPGARAVGVVGRVRPDKGQGDFVEAVAPLLSRFEAWTPVLVGLAKGGDAAWAEGLKAKTGGKLVLAGEQADVATWYRGLDVLVQSSHGEAFSMVVLEAMASGCCVVASRLPYMHRVLEHERTGLFYEPGDAQGLRAQLERVLADDALRQRLGGAAAEEAKRRFGVAQEVAALRTLYEGRSEGVDVVG
ncbi:MAG: glycosyltransferase family 4 protein [Myxococcota bacterium]